MVEMTWNKGVDLEPSVISPYHSRRNYWYLKSDAELTKKAELNLGHDAFDYIGCELELNFPKEEHAKSFHKLWHKAFAASLFKNMRSRDGAPLFFTEYDSNIPNGFEVITQPATYGYWCEKLAHYFKVGIDITRDHGARAGVGIPGGLHFHFSAHKYSNKTLARILMAVNNPRWYRDWTRHINRDVYTLNKYAAFINVKGKIRHLLKPFSKINSVVSVLADNLNVFTSKDETLNFRDGHTHYANRYRAVNIMNTANENPMKRTVEFRMFKGTILPEYIMLYMGMCKSVIDMCIVSGDKEFADMYYHHSLDDVFKTYSPGYSAFYPDDSLLNKYYKIVESFSSGHYLYPFSSCEHRPSYWDWVAYNTYTSLPVEFYPRAIRLIDVDANVNTDTVSE